MPLSTNIKFVTVDFISLISAPLVFWTGIPHFSKLYSKKDNYPTGFLLMTIQVLKLPLLPHFFQSENLKKNPKLFGFMFKGSKYSTLG